MSFEAAPPNRFRATALKGQREPLLVTEKRRGRSKSPTKGLAAITVARSESRSANLRSGDRHRLSDEQAMVRHKGRRHVVELVNLSHGGAMVAAKFKAKL